MKNSFAWFLPFVLLSTTVVGVPILIFDPKGLPRYQALGNELHRIENANVRLRTDVERLQKEVRSLRTDPATIEAIARDELGMVYEGEIVFQFND